MFAEHAGGAAFEASVNPGPGWPILCGVFAKGGSIRALAPEGFRKAGKDGGRNLHRKSHDVRIREGPPLQDRKDGPPRIVLVQKVGHTRKIGGPAPTEINSPDVFA